MSLPLTNFEFTLGRTAKQEYGVKINISDNKVDEPGTTNYMVWYKQAMRFVNALHDKVKSYETYCDFDFTEYTSPLHTYKIKRLKKNTIGYDREGNQLWEVKWIGPMKNS